MEQVTIEIAVDADLVNQARAILDEMGLNLEAVVGDFLRYIVRERDEICAKSPNSADLNKDEALLRFSVFSERFISDLFAKHRKVMFNE